MDHPNTELVWYSSPHCIRNFGFGVQMSINRVSKFQLTYSEIFCLNKHKLKLWFTNIWNVIFWQINLPNLFRSILTQWMPYLKHPNTVGIWNLDWSGFQMVEKRLVCKWSGFQMGSEIWSKMSRFWKVQFSNGWDHSCNHSPTLWKPDHL